MDSSLWITHLLILSGGIYVLGCCIFSVMDKSQKGHILFKL